MQKKPLYKIVSDGTVGGTFIYDPNGNKLERVVKLTYEVDVKHSLSKLRLEIVGCAIDAKGILVSTKTRKK